MPRRLPLLSVLVGALLTVASPMTLAAVGSLDLTQSTVGYLAVAIFILAYLIVMGEEKLRLRKSKPVLVAAGIIWAMIGWVYVQQGVPAESEEAFRQTMLEFGELMLFLLVAMTYINALDERRLFDLLRAWLIRKGFNYRTLFLITGALAFCISPIADNLTTAMLMAAVVIKIAPDDTRFVRLCCINIVVAANAGGSFSPFGDITSLMVWQAGKLEFFQFFQLFIPALVAFVIPSLIMSFFVENRTPEALDEVVELKRGAVRIACLFLLTIVTAVLFHLVLNLPPVAGMMMGLGYLQFFGYFLRRTLPGSLARKRARAERAGDEAALRRLGSVVPFDVFNRVARAEWDTLLFFYGVMMCIGGLGFLGYLSLLSEMLYTDYGATMANISLGVMSALIDNIPVMFAVLTMDPTMSEGHWLLIILAAVTGGSLLSMGSAAGVAVMGQARGYYTFMGHLKWTPVVALGFVAGVAVHLWLNADTFEVIIP